MPVGHEEITSLVELKEAQVSRAQSLYDAAKATLERETLSLLSLQRAKDESYRGAAMKLTLHS